MDKKDIIFGLLALAALIGLLWYGGSLNKDKVNQVAGVTPEAVSYFSDEMSSTTIANGNRPIEGFIPSMFMTAFPGLRASDFDGVEAEQGKYAESNGEVSFEYNVSVEERHTAAMAITTDGMETLLENVSARLSLPAQTKADVDVILSELRLVETANVVPEQRDVPDGGEDRSPANPSPTPSPRPAPGTGGYICTMDAKLCPDGSYVGRSGPKCEFAKCPGEATTGFRTCPDEWIQNRMPGIVGEDDAPREYFIIDGQRWEIENFDVNWVRNNCSVEPQAVY